MFKKHTNFLKKVLDIIGKDKKNFEKEKKNINKQKQQFESEFNDLQRKIDKQSKNTKQ